MPFETQNRQKSGDYSLAVCILASGSKGNATYISDGQTSILVDAGLSGVALERRLAARGLAPESLDAIIVSHEHADHIKGVGILSRRYHLPVYINQKTVQASPQLGRLHELRSFECGRTFNIRRLSVHPFSISHDALMICLRMQRLQRVAYDDRPLFASFTQRSNLRVYVEI